jgi:hypothetical protein
LGPFVIFKKMKCCEYYHRLLLISSLVLNNPLASWAHSQFLKKK